MKYKLIASDMDGTLLNSRSEITERTKSAITAAVDAGAYFVTATGRPLCNIRIVNDILTRDMPFIIFNGSAAYMGKSEEQLFEKFLDTTLACEAFELGQELGLAQIVWASAQLWANRVCEETIRYRDFSTTPGMRVADDLKIIANESQGISKVLWIADPALIADKRLEMAAHFDGRLNCYSSMPPFLEFVSIEASKGTALVEIGARFGIDRSEMIAVGDAYNDVPMLEYAGFSVAMGNAPDDIKAMCSFVTDTNDNDGVAAVIKKYML